MQNYLGELKNNVFDQDRIYSKLIFPYSLSSRGKTKYSELMTTAKKKIGINILLYFMLEL